MGPGIRLGNTGVFFSSSVKTVPLFFFFFLQFIGKQFNNSET